MQFIRIFCLLFMIGLLPLTAIASQNFSSDYHQNLPELKAPKAGTLQGSLSKFNPSVSELSQGSLSIPLAINVEQSRGPLLVNPFPSYNIHNGLSEWGQGFEVMLSIQRYREIGDLNFVDDDYVSPWGVLIKGSDGSWYPRGLKAAVKVDISKSEAIAYLGDGTVWNFKQSIPSTDPSAPYGFVLTEVKNLVGDKTLLIWRDGTRPLLTEIRYGSKDASSLPYMIRLNYETLPKDNLIYSYRSKRLAQITNRIQSVQFFDLTFSSIRARWSYSLQHEYSVYSPAFYLKSYQKTFSSGAVEPAILIKWSRFDDFIKAAKSAPTDRINEIVQETNVGGISSRGLSFFDYDNDGLVDIEVAKTHKLYRQTTSGFELVADYEAERDWKPCLPPDAMGSDARRIVRLTGPYGRPLVFMNLVGSGRMATRLLACELDGRVVYDEDFAVDFSQDALVTLGDLNGDQRPDLVKLTPSSIEVLENVSTESQIKFIPRPGFSLDSATLETNLSIADINGDGIPDLFMHEGSSGRAFFGKGNFEFTKKYTILPYHSSHDQSYDVGSKSSINFVDANGDGLTDLAISNGNEFYLLMNLGLRFKMAPVPFTEGLGNEGEALTVNILGGGNPMVFRSSGSKDIRGMELSDPGIGLLKSMDDGQGNVVSFEFDWQRPEKAKLQLQKQLLRIKKYSLGKGTITLDLEYGRSQLGAKKPYLLGYDTVKQKGPLLEFFASFKNPEESPGLLSSVVQKDLAGSSLEQVKTIEHVSRFMRGVNVWFKKSENVFNRSGTRSSVPYTRTFEYMPDSICAGRETLTLGSDSLTTSFAYADIAGIEKGLGCPLTSVERRGRHARKDFDFDESLTIELNDLGLPESIKQQRPDGEKTLQKIRYDSRYRVDQIRNLAGLVYAIGYHGDTNWLDLVETSIGVRSEVLERTDLGQVRVMVTRRGEEDAYKQRFEYDSFERLKDTFDNASGDMDGPLESIRYVLGTASKPGSIQTTRRASSGVFSIDESFFTADGSLFATLLTLENGRVIQNLQSFDAEKGYLTQHASAVETDDFLDSWQTYQNGADRKLERFSDGFGEIRSAFITHQRSKVENTKGFTSVNEGGVARENVSNGKYRTVVQKDALGRLIGKRDETGLWSKFLYDIQGRIREVELADGTKQTAAYDNFGRIIKISRSSFGSIDYLYDNRDLMLRKDFRSVDGNLYRVVALEYDAYGRLIKRSSSANGRSQSVNYYYDGFTPTPEFYQNQKGLLTAIRGENFETRLIHDGKGRLIREIKSVNPVNVRQEKILEYFDNDLVRSSESIVSVNGANLLRTSWENELRADGLLRAVKLNGNTLATLSYDQLGRIYSAEIAGGQWTVVFSHDSVTGEIDGYVAETRNRRTAYNYTKDSRGNVESESMSGFEKTYGYDDRSFLTAVVSGDESETFTYDAIGLLSPTVGSGKGLDFDPIGRLRQKNGILFTYDGQGQIASARMEDDTIISYGYDENELRNLKMKNGQFHSARFGDTVVTKDLVLEPLRIAGILVGYIENGSFKPLLGDLRGSVIDDGAQYTRISALGKRSGSVSWQTLIDFAGHSRDEDTGLIRMGVRDYDSDLGKFVEPDPLFMEDLEKCAERPIECNLYSYARNNPLLYVDPSGKIVDALADILFMSYDVASFTVNAFQGDIDGMKLDALALAADTAGLFTPVVTGAGLVVRAEQQGLKLFYAGTKESTQAGIKGVQVHQSSSVPKSRVYDRPWTETKSGNAVREKDAVGDWDKFLGPNQSSIDPRDGLFDPDRIWSQDGSRSIRFGEHEMGSKKMHYHKEKWYNDRVENLMQRVQK